MISFGKAASGNERAEDSVTMSRMRRLVDLCVRTPGAACFVLGTVALFLTFKSGFPPVVGIALGLTGLILLGAGELILFTLHGRDDA